MVLASPLAWEPLAGRPREPWRWVIAVLVVVALLLTGSSFVHLPYFIESPGSAPAVAVSVSPASRAHHGRGSILLSTVALQTTVDPLQLVEAWFNPDESLVPKQDLTGGVSATQFNQQNLAEMDQSKQVAVLVALRRLGYREMGDGVYVTAVEPQSPADGRLAVGDVVTSADGKNVSLDRDLVTVIRAHAVGSSVALGIERPDHTRTKLTLTVGGCPAQICGTTAANRPYLGVGLQTRNDRFDVPFKVQVDLADVGGPSAGLAFTLGVINALTTGNITGGHKVAVTGTINPDGTVGPIGGIALKTVAVERQGAEYFLVPKDDNVPGSEAQYRAAAAKARGHKLKVIAVGTLDDAINALRSIGGDLTGVSPTSH